MKQIKGLLLLLLSVYLSGTSVYAQDGKKIPIAVIGFMLAPNASVNNPGDVNTLQDIVTSEFVSRSRFIILDRTRFDAVLKELKIQKSEEFLDSKVVEQGRMLGAKYIVTGIVSSFKSQTVTMTKSVPIDPKYPLGAQTTRVEQVRESTINFSFQVIDVEKGTSVYSKAISGAGKSTSSLDKNDLEKALCLTRKDIRSSILAMFPNEIHIIKLELVDKKGRAEKVLIDAGEGSFSENSGKTDPCGTDVGNTLKNLFGRKKGTPLMVYEIEKMTVNGKEIIREKTVGKIEVDKIEGEISVCNVRDGEKEIVERFNAGASLMVKII